MRENKRNKSPETLFMALIIIAAAVIVFNQAMVMSIAQPSSSRGGLMGLKLLSGSQGNADLSSADTESLASTAMTVATVFPELREAKTQEEIMAVMYPGGTPEYSQQLGGITFDDAEKSMNYLAKWYFTIKKDVQENDPETWQRYLDLAAAPKGISCEFCCGVGAQGIDEKGNLRCGCLHNPAIQALTLGLMEHTDYTDAEILREAMLWKTSWFPKNMISLASQVAGQDPSQIKSMPGMVGGC